MGGILHASARLLSPSLPACLIAALLSGCLYYHRWTRPGATEQDFYQDSMRCHRETAPRWAFCWGAACDAQASARKDAVERCLRAAGWRSVGVVSMTGGSDEEYAGK